MSLLTARNATFQDLRRLLEEQQDAKIDVVAPATALRSRNAAIELSGVEPLLEESGFTLVDGLYLPTASADGDIAAKLRIPAQFLRRLRIERPDLYDSNVNGLLHGKTRRGRDGRSTVLHPSDERKFLLRMFRGQDGGDGVLRALLSDSYGLIDHLDVLLAVLDGIRQADVDVSIRSCDLTESSMRAKVFSPKVSALAPRFLDGYRNPFANPALEAERRRISTAVDHWHQGSGFEGTGSGAGDEPVVFAGFRVANSETGDGAVTLKPELLIQVCSNGLTLPALAIRKVHMGSKLEQGAVSWSLDTQRKHLSLITAQARDAVARWLSPEFLAKQVDELEQQAGAPVTEPDTTIRAIAQSLKFSDAEREGILRHFTAGGQLSAGGLAHAVTSFSQTVADADRADALDDLALKAMAACANI
ncbi:hypothetical protein [Saccharopolyspora elongata]|uniref:DUF932 domain-containing protein n=1 Tax=Saccharopolyspora elongata TaxID=2530387 RepID=A0A4R4XWV8_9PSEU|nr:hypothetical protein [Saccharopolyspora elongata]TDD35489.1 hypothetical protein E1288_43085 [Saccharopolyspora elongata]